MATKAKSTKKSKAATRNPAKRGGAREMTLSARTRASALGTWIAQREKTSPDFGAEVQSAYSAVTQRPGMGWKVAQAEPRQTAH